MSSDFGSKLESTAKSWIDTIVFLRKEAKDLEKLYFQVVSGDITALAGTDPATVASALTKNQLVSAVTHLQQFQNFFNNSAVTQADYMGGLVERTNGNDEATAIVSNATESFGDRVKVFAQLCIDTDKQAREIEAEYFDTEFSDCVSNISSGTVMFGTNSPASVITNGITMFQQYLNFQNNSAVTTGDYLDSVNKWLRYLS